MTEILIKKPTVLSGLLLLVARCIHGYALSLPVVCTFMVPQTVGHAVTMKRHFEILQRGFGKWERIQSSEVVVSDKCGDFEYTTPI